MLTHFVASDDVAGSWRFHTDVPGGKTAMEGEPPLAALASNRIIIKHARRATDDKPSVTLQDQPAAHPMALINPRLQRSHQGPVPASRSPRRPANQAGRCSSIAAEHLFCAP